MLMMLAGVGGLGVVMLAGVWSWGRASAADAHDAGRVGVLV